MRKRVLSILLTGTLMICAAATGCGKKSNSEEPFIPEKTINWMCTSSTGGGSDIFTHEIADIMIEQNLVNGQNIMVTNKTDSFGEVGRDIVAHTSKDADYQLLTFNSGDLTPMVTNSKNRSSDFRILAIMAIDKQLLFKTEFTPYDSFTEVISAVKNGKKVIIAGSKDDDYATYKALVSELEVSEESLTYITYDSTADAITVALGGHVDLLLSKPAAASEFVENGSLIPILALSSERYSGNLADAPTLSEIGDYDDVEIPVWRGVAAPAAMSDQAAAFWSDVLTKVSETDEWKNDYLEPNQLIANHMDMTEATEYVANYEKEYMEENGIR